MPALTPRLRQVLVLVAAFAVIGVWWGASGPDPAPHAGADGTVVATLDGPAPSASPNPTAPPRAPESPPRGPAHEAPLDRVLGYYDLPAEAQETIDLIRAGGPFPYDRDGITFGNFEGLLPPEPRGWYREYTVPTPGLDHRGARRIVVGRDGTMYYTHDHYASFTRIEAR